MENIQLECYAVSGRIELGTYTIVLFLVLYEYRNASNIATVFCVCIHMNWHIVVVADTLEKSGNTHTHAHCVCTYLSLCMCTYAERLVYGMLPTSEVVQVCCMNATNATDHNERHRGDSNPCGQSPMDFESISLAARTQCRWLLSSAYASSAQ